MSDNGSTVERALYFVCLLLLLQQLFQLSVFKIKMLSLQERLPPIAVSAPLLLSRSCVSVSFGPWPPYHASYFRKIKIRLPIRCSDSSARKRGFGRKSGTSDEKKAKAPPGQSQQAPGLSFKSDRRTKYTYDDDIDFEQRLQAVRKSALERRKVEEEKVYGVIDYDGPAETNSATTSMGSKNVIGVGVAVIGFALVFALGDFVPSGSFGPTQDASTINNISEEERTNLEKKLKQFEEALDVSPEDLSALEGASVTLLEMGEYKRAMALLGEFVERVPNNPDAFRLLGEVKYELKDYEGSVLAYRSAESVSRSVDFDILKGFTNSLLAAKRPDEAVKLLLASRGRLNNENYVDRYDGTDGGMVDTRFYIDPIQVELLLGKAYSQWGHISDAVSVYDQLISDHPDDFRGYLAKGVLLKENGNSGDAERMFIQARFFAPEKAKVVVDKYSR